MTDARTESGIKRDQLSVFSVAEGFFQSSVPFVLIRLGMFEQIGDGSRGLGDLAAGWDVWPDILARRLNAEVASGCLQRKARNGIVSRRWPVLLDLIQLCITERGTNHSVGKTRSWLMDAGYERVEFCPMTILNTNSYLRAYRP